jgi:hypothetical protein
MKNVSTKILNILSEIELTTFWDKSVKMTNSKIWHQVRMNLKSPVQNELNIQLWNQIERAVKIKVSL